MDETTGSINVAASRVQKEKERSLGTIYGVVKSINVIKDRYLMLYDIHGKSRIKVFYGDGLTDVVRESFDGGEVMVTGFITYAEDGTRESMAALKIEPRVQEEAPHLIDLFGIIG